MIPFKRQNHLLFISASEVEFTDTATGQLLTFRKVNLVDMESNSLIVNAKVSPSTNLKELVPFAVYDADISYKMVTAGKTQVSAVDVISDFRLIGQIDYKEIKK